jgi:predicted Zn-dependent protease
VRQAGSVEQAYLTLRLVAGRRHASATLSLGGDGDAAASQAALQTLRQTLEGLPDDPWLLFNESPRSSESVRRGTLAPVEGIVDEVTAAAGNADLVGIYAAGTTSRGFANSLGQRNWHEVDSFNLDWSLYAEGDRAVKSSYAGFAWNTQALAGKMAAASDELALLEKPRRDIAPGEYRAYLAPRALEEILGLLAWGGFSARARATRQSPLLRMESGARLSPIVSMSENTAEGVSPGFQADGFLKPAQVELISRGRLAEPLISPRSAKEYGLATNAAGGGESPDSLDVAAGELEEKDVLRALGRGLRISNLWYLNFSDRPAGRMTGMTRFATFWVEEGRIVAPASVLRFDDSIYRLLGEALVGLTSGRELLLDPSTYGERSTRSARLPGALVRSMRFTL